jgi:O-antigen/teichoic acid export membrane protein
MTTTAYARQLDNVVAIRKRLFQNSLLLGVSRLLSTCTALISVPIIVVKLGLTGYGGWEAIMAIAAICTGFQQVISGALVWKMSEAYGNDNRAGIERLARIGIGVALTLFLLSCPTVWALRYQMVALSNIPAPYRAVARWVLPWLVSQMVLGSVGETFGAVLISHQRAGVMTLIQSGAVVANNAFVIFGLARGWQLWSLLAGNTVAVGSTIIGLYIAVARISGGAIRVIPLLPTWTEAKPLLRYAGFLALGCVSVILRDQTDKLVLANVGSTLWTAWFGMASRLANLILIVCGFFYVPLVSAVAALNARGDWAGVRKLYDNVMIALPLLMGAIVVLIASAYDRLLVMWIGRPVPQVGPLLFILLAGNITAVVLTGTGTSLCKGVGRVEIETTYVVVCVVLNITLKFILTWTLGPIGSVLASATSWALSSVVFIILLHRILSLPKVTFRAAITVPLMAAAVAIARFAAGAPPSSSTRWHAALSVAEIGLFAIAVYVVLLIATGALPLPVFRRMGSICRDAIMPRRGVRYEF